MEPFKSTESEQQLIEVLREQNGDGDFRLIIERIDGAWEIVMSTSPHDKRHKARGVGNTFDQAWTGMAPGWA